MIGVLFFCVYVSFRVNRFLFPMGGVFSMVNHYAGKCHACGCQVLAGDGVIERKEGYFKRSHRGAFHWLLWCMPCFNASDVSGSEDCQCGPLAYEDRCARACGMDPNRPSDESGRW